MKLTVLGCAGGIGGRERLTTCLLLDEDVLLDTGTGLATLGIEDLVKIDHVFLTHTHLDHVAGLALLVDATQGKRSGPLTIHATEPVIAALKKHLFNWVLWPDFGVIPNEQAPVMRWETMAHGATVDLGRGRQISSHAVNHTVGSAAYQVIHQGTGGVLFTGDMCATPSLWQMLAASPLVSKVIVDCSFSNAEAELAALSMHFCPSSLIADISGLPKSLEFLIYHLKPGQEDLIMQELQASGDGRAFRALSCGDQFDF